jgi:hypothetical protein
MKLHRRLGSVYEDAVKFRLHMCVATDVIDGGSVLSAQRSCFVVRGSLIEIYLERLLIRFSGVGTHAQ